MKHREPFKSVGYQFAGDLPLLTLQGIGFHHITSTEYCWDNRGRSGTYGLLQYGLEGEGVLEIEGTLYPIRPGQAFLLEIPGPHSYALPSRSSHWTVLFMEFSKECLPLLQTILRQCGPILDLSGGPIPERMEAIYHQALKESYINVYENAQCAFRFWLELLQWCLEYAGPSSTRMDEAKRYIEQHAASSTLTLDEIAAHVQLSKYHFSRMFKEAFDISPGAYIKEIRMAQACQLLSTRQDESLQDIAEKVGYTSDSYFGKVFKAEKGMTPDQYRKLHPVYDIVHTVYEAQTLPEDSSR